MIVTLGQTVTPAIAHENVSGAPSNASSIAFTLWRNGVATAEAITPTNPETGVYRISFTIPSGWAVGDFLQVRAVADGIARFVWAATIDARVASRAIPGDEMGLTSAVLTALFADVDTAALVASIVAQFDEASDLPADTIATLAASRTVTALATLIADAAAAKTAAESADGKLASGRLSRIDRLPDINAGTTGGLALHGATGGGSGDAEQATSLEILDKIDALSVGLAGGSPVEPTGVTVFEHLELIQSQTSQITGSRISSVGPVKPGGDIELIVGKDYKVEAGTNGTHLPIAIADVDGVVYGEFTSGTLAASKSFGMRRDNGDALIAGTVHSLVYSADVTTFKIEIDADQLPDTLDLTDDYTYQIQRVTSTGKKVVGVKGTGAVTLRTV